MLKKKYEMTDQWFELSNGKIVTPFNGENVEQVSWSHGLTHFKDKKGNVGFCGQTWFEKNAKEIKNVEVVAIAVILFVVILTPAFLSGLSNGDRR